MKILVLGDSTSFGAELPDLPVTYFGYYGNDYIDNQGQKCISPPSNLAWPALVAKELGCDVDNRSIVGGSNDRIFRLAIEQTVTKAWDLVICAWTSTDRYDLTYKSRDVALTATVVWDKFPWVKEFVTAHWDPDRQDTNFMTRLLALQSYFAQRRQPYLYVKSLDIKLKPSVTALHNCLDKTYCVDWDNNFYTWAAGTALGKDGHFLQAGHEIVANIMCQHIRKLQIGF